MIALQLLDLLSHCKGSPAWTVVYLAYWIAVLLFLALAQMHATVERKTWSSPFLFPSEPLKFDETRSRDKFLLLSMKINVEIHFRMQKVFSDVLEDIASKLFL